MKKTSTKRSLIMSLLSMVICIVMLIGSTFAWFTDTETSKVNKISSGNLDIGVYYATPADVVNGDIPEENWKALNENEAVFNEAALWEPGYTEAVFFKFVNEGSLALQYQLKVDILEEVIGKSATGADIQLSNYIQAYACNNFAWNYKEFLFTERNDATNPAGAPNPFHDTLYNAANGAVATPNGDNPLSLDSWQWLEDDEITYATLVLWMPTNVGNEANHDGTNVPSIDLGVSVVATQYTKENDTFGNQYDKDAEFPNLVFDSKDVNEKLEDGENVMFADDVEAPLSNEAIYGTPVAIQQKNGGVIDGNGKSLDIINPVYNGYAIETYGGTIKNLTIDSTVGRGIVISNPQEDIYISNVVVDGPGYAINTTEHNGKKLVVTNSTVKGWTSLAGLDSVSFVNCIFGENASKYWQKNGYDQDYDRLIRPYILAEFNQCVFEKGFYIDLSALGSDCIITLDKCTVNGVVLTADNYEGNITIELPSGRTVADCVIFK